MTEKPLPASVPSMGPHFCIYCLTPHEPIWRIDRQLDVIWTIYGRARLTPQCTDLAYIVGKRGGLLTPRETVIKELWGVQPPLCADAMLRNIVWRTNKKIEPIGLFIERIGGRGYALLQFPVGTPNEPASHI